MRGSSNTGKTCPFCHTDRSGRNGEDFSRSGSCTCAGGEILVQCRNTQRANVCGRSRRALLCSCRKGWKVNVATSRPPRRRHTKTRTNEWDIGSIPILWLWCGTPTLSLRERGNNVSYSCLDRLAVLEPGL